MKTSKKGGKQVARWELNCCLMHGPKKTIMAGKL